MPITMSTMPQYRPDIASALETFDIESDRLGFIGHRLFPVIEVDDQSGRFPKVDVRLWLGEEDTRRAPGGNYNEVSFGTDWDYYGTQEHGLQSRLDDRLSKIYSRWFNHQVLRARHLTDKIRRSAERRIAKAAFDPTGFNADQVIQIATPWSDPGSTPTTDISIGQEPP